MAVPVTAPETVRHQKAAGNGYLPGSPLYDKQERLAGTMGMPRFNLSVWQWIIAVIVDILIFMFLAYLYTIWQPQANKNFDLVSLGNLHKENMESCGGFEAPLCGCANNPLLCIQGWCCMPCRWAHTHNGAGLIRYWPAVMVMGLLLFLSPMTAGVTGLIALCILVFKRQDLRRKLGLKHTGGMTVLEDCCVYMFCGCCAIVQEARSVDGTLQKQQVGPPSAPQNSSTGGSRGPYGRLN